ncbi:hypothetical protein GQ53DRAFT_523174 [Thozetella sp. PMI_491]|nr:hypothetical protein GQ53DRAFT_523174 [Thozetella sp. PMI_491]
MTASGRPSRPIRAAMSKIKSAPARGDVPVRQSRLSGHGERRRGGRTAAAAGASPAVCLETFGATEAARRAVVAEHGKVLSKGQRRERRGNQKKKAKMGRNDGEGEMEGGRRGNDSRLSRLLPTSLSRSDSRSDFLSSHARVSNWKSCTTSRLVHLSCASLSLRLAPNHDAETVTETGAADGLATAWRIVAVNFAKAVHDL